MKIFTATILANMLFVSCAATGQVPGSHKKTTHTAGDTTSVTNSYEVPIGKSGVTVGPSATTIYTKPGRGPDGPVHGNQVGSSSNTGFGATVTIPLGSGTKK